MNKEEKTDATEAEASSTENVITISATELPMDYAEAVSDWESILNQGTDNNDLLTDIYETIAELQPDFDRFTNADYSEDIGTINQCEAIRDLSASEAKSDALLDSMLGPEFSGKSNRAGDLSLLSPCLLEQQQQETPSNMLVNIGPSLPALKIVDPLANIRSLSMESPYDEVLDIDNNLIEPGEKPIELSSPYHPRNVWSSWDSLDFEGGLPLPPRRPFLEEATLSVGVADSGQNEVEQVCSTYQGTLVSDVVNNNCPLEQSAPQQESLSVEPLGLGISPGCQPSESKEETIRRNSLPEPLFRTLCQDNTSGRNLLILAEAAEIIADQDSTCVKIPNDEVQYSYPVSTVSNEILMTPDPPDLLTLGLSSSQDPLSAKESLTENLSSCQPSGKKGFSDHGSDSGVNSETSSEQRIPAWILESHDYLAGSIPQQDYQVFTVTVETDGATGGTQGPESELRPEETLTETPTFRMKTIDVQGLHAKQDLVSVDSRESYRKNLEMISKTLKSIKSPEPQTVKGFTASLKGSDFIAPDVRKPHEMFRRGKIVHWKTTGADAVITVEFDCPTLEMECQTKRCPYCLNKEVELVEFAFPSRGAADKHWMLIIPHVAEVGEKMKALDQLLKQLLSYISEPEEDMGVDDSLSQISDVTNFPQDSETAISETQIGWKSDLNWTPDLMRLKKGKAALEVCKEHRKRLQKVKNQIHVLQTRDKLPYTGDFSLSNRRAQVDRIFGKQEDYYERIVKAIKEIANFNCSSAASQAVDTLTRSVYDFLDECRQKTHELENEYRIVSNQWKFGVDPSGQWEAYKELEVAPISRSSHSPDLHSTQKPRSQRRARSYSPSLDREPAIRAPNQRKRKVKKAQKEPYAGRGSSSSSSSGSESESSSSQTSSAVSASTVRHAHSTGSRCRAGPTNRDLIRVKEEFTDRESWNHDRDPYSFSREENSDFCRIVGSKSDLKQYLRVVSGQVIKSGKGKSSKVKQAADKLQQEVEDWVETMIRHNQPSFSTILEFSEPQLKEEVEVGNNERLKLKQRVDNGEKAVGKALSALSSAMFNSKGHEAASWEDCTRASEGLLKGPAGRTHTDLMASWSKFFSKLDDLIVDALRKRNIVKHSHKSSTGLKDMDIAKFTGEADAVNFYVWVKNFKTSVNQAGISEEETPQALKKFIGGPVKTLVQNLLVGGHHFQDIIEVIRERFGRPSVIISQAKIRHKNIGSLGEVDLLTNNREDLKIIMTKLDAHLRLITEIEYVETGLAEHEESKLPPGSSARRKKKVKKEATKEVLTGEYLRTLQYLVPQPSDAVPLEDSASTSEKFRHYKRNLELWLARVTRDVQERPVDLKPATAHTLLATTVDSNCLTSTSTALPAPRNPPQTLPGGTPGGEVPTRLQERKENQKGRGRDGPGAKGKAVRFEDRPGQAPGDRRAQSAPPGRCKICKKRNQEEYHLEVDCPHRDEHLAETAQLEDRVCAVCSLDRETPQSIPKSKHVVVRNKIPIRHFCETIRNKRVTEVSDALKARDWCLTCIVPPKMHDNTPFNNTPQGRTCNKKIYLKCTRCLKHSKTCVEHYNHNKDQLAVSTSIAQRLGIDFNCSLATFKLESEEDVHSGGVVLFTAAFEQPKLHQLHDDKLKERLQPRTSILQGLRMTYPSGKQGFVLFDNGSTENMAISTIVGRELEAWTDPSVEKIRVRGIGGDKEVRPVELEIPVKNRPSSRMAFQETNQILRIHPTCFSPLLKLLKREHQLRRQYGLLGRGDTRDRLDEVSISVYGGEIEILFGISTAGIRPQRLFQSIYGTFVFTTALDTGSCPPYGIAGPQPDLEDYASFLKELEAKKPDALKRVKDLLNQQLKDFKNDQQVSLVSEGSGVEEGFLDLKLPDLPCWVTADLESEIKKEMRSDCGPVLITRGFAQQEIPGASEVLVELMESMPCFFIHFCGDDNTTSPEADWKLLVQGKKLGIRQMLEAANWIWQRMNSEQYENETNVALGVTSEGLGDPLPAIGYVCITLPADGSASDSWEPTPEEIGTWLQKHGKKAELSNMSKSETSFTALRLLDTHVAPTSDYVSYFVQQQMKQEVPESASPTEWKWVQSHYPRFLASLTKNQPQPPATASEAIRVEQNEAVKGSSIKPATGWVESNHFKGTYFVGIVGNGEDRDQDERFQAINRMLDPQAGEFKNESSFAKRLGPAYEGFVGEDRVKPRKKTDLQSTFLAVPMLNYYRSNAVFIWIQVILSLVNQTNLCIYDKKRVFLRALQPAVVGNLISFRFNVLSIGLTAFLGELARVLRLPVGPHQHEVQVLHPTKQPTRPPFGPLKEFSSGCSRLFNMIVRPKQWDGNRKEDFLPVSFPVLNSTDTKAVFWWSFCCEVLIVDYELISSVANAAVINSIALALRPVLTGLVSFDVNNKDPTTVLIAVQQRFNQISTPEVSHSSTIINIREFFISKFTAMRQEVKNGKVYFNCHSHSPEPCGPYCFCLGCDVCKLTCDLKLMYSKKLGKYVWLAAPDSQCFSCQGLTTSAATGLSCLCHLCRLIDKVLKFSLDAYHKIDFDSDCYYEKDENPNIPGNFDSRLAKRFNSTGQSETPSLGQPSALPQKAQEPNTGSQSEERATEKNLDFITTYVVNPEKPEEGKQKYVEVFVAGRTTNSGENKEVEPEPSKPSAEFNNDGNLKSEELPVEPPEIKEKKPNSAAEENNKCGHRCTDGCANVTRTILDPCDIQDVLSQRWFVRKRQDRLPADANVHDMHKDEVLFWKDHFTAEEEMGNIDLTRRNLFRILVNAREKAWKELGCFNCRSPVPAVKLSRCAFDCRQQVLGREIVIQRELGLRIRQGHPVPFLKQGVRIPKVVPPAKVRQPHLSSRSRQGNSKDWKGNCRNVLHIQPCHDPVTIQDTSCCSKTSFPALYHDSEKDAKIFKARLEETSKDHLTEDKKTGTIHPLVEQNGKWNKFPQVTMRAINDTNIDTLIFGLYEAYRQKRKLISNLQVNYPYCEIGLTCSNTCSRGCLTPDLGCFCEGCPFCVNKPGIQDCFLNFAKQLQTELMNYKSRPMTLIHAVLWFDIQAADQDASFLARNGRPNNNGKIVPIRQDVYRRKMAELRKFCVEFPEAKVTAECRGTCRQEGRCQGAKRGCYCDGCLFCSETIGLGKTYLRLSDFARKLRQDENILKKVQGLQDLNLGEEQRVAEAARRPGYPTRQPGSRFPFFLMMCCLISLFGGLDAASSVVSGPLAGPSWPQPGLKIDYNLLHSSEFLNSVPGLARSATKLSGPANASNDTSGIERPDSWVDPSRKYVLALANCGICLWSLSSAMAFTIRELADNVLRAVSSRIRLSLPSQSTFSVNSNPVVDPQLHKFLMLNRGHHKKVYWRLPRELGLKKKIDRELDKFSKVTLTLVNKPRQASSPEEAGTNATSHDSDWHDCFHCLNGCPAGEPTEEEPETGGSCMVADVDFQEILEKLQEEGLSPFMRCRSCRACKVCGKLGENMNKKLRKDQEHDYIRSCIFIRDHPKDPNKKEVFMKYPRREGWESKLTPNRGLAVKNLQSVARDLMKESKESQEKVLSQMQKLLDNGFVTPVSQIEDWDQLVEDCPIPGGYYTTHTLAFKPNSANTDVRLCANFSKECSTGKCMNNLLVEGETFYNFRAFSTDGRKTPANASMDVSKFFNSVKLINSELPLNRILWFTGNNITTDSTQWTEYVLATGWYGASCQPCVMEHVKDEIANRHPEIRGIYKDYVDDVQTPSNHPDVSKHNMQLVTKVFGTYGLKSKGSAVSGEDPDESLTSNSGYVDVAGTHWDSKNDLVQPIINPVFMGRKEKGRLLDADVFSGSSLKEILEWGRKFNWNVNNAAEQLARAWDYAHGFLTPLRGMLSVVLRAAHNWAHLKGVEHGTDRRQKALWQYELPDFLRDQLLTTLFLIQDYRQFWFPRCRVKPEDLVDLKDPEYDLVTFVDAGKDCLQAIHYILYKVKGDQWKASYLWSTNKLRPVLTRKLDGTQAQQTMPKSELAAAAMGTAGAMEIASLNCTKLRKAWLCTDSTCSILWITSPNCILDPYTNPRVQLIRDSYPLDQILYVTTEDQPADTGTKGISSVEEIGPESVFFKGPDFLSKGIEACLGKELRTREQIPELQKRGMVAKAGMMSKTEHAENLRKSAMERLNQMHDQMTQPKEHLTNLLVNQPSYFSLHRERLDLGRAEVVIRVTSSFTRAHLLSILTLIPRMNFLIDRQTNTISLYSASNKEALPNKGRISVQKCSFPAVCFLLGRQHKHSPLTEAISAQASDYLPLKPKDLTPIEEVKVPWFVNHSRSMNTYVGLDGTTYVQDLSSLLNNPTDALKVMALDRPPVRVPLMNMSANEIRKWSKQANNVYVGDNDTIPLGFLQEYWINSTSEHSAYRESFCSDIRHLRTVPFLRGKQLGCDCQSQAGQCHVDELIKIYEDYYRVDPSSLLQEPKEDVSSPPPPQFQTTLKGGCLITTPGTLKKMVRDDDLFLNVTSRPLDKAITTVALTLMAVEKWIKRCASSTSLPTRSTTNWGKRLQGISRWQTENRYIVDVLEVNPLDKLMGYSADQEGRHAKKTKERPGKEASTPQQVDAFLRRSDWYSYPGFSLVFNFCRTASKSSEPSFEQLSFQFTSIVMLLSSLIGMSKTKHTRPGLFTASKAALCWIKHACKELEANFMSGLLDFPNLFEFYDSDSQRNRLQPQSQKRFLLRQWEQNFGLNLNAIEFGSLPKYGVGNQSTVLWSTAEDCSRLIRSAGFYLVLKTQQAHAAFAARDVSSKFGQINEDGVTLSPRRLRQAVDLVEILDIQEGPELDRLRGVQLNVNVPYLPMSPLLQAIVSYFHHFFRISPVNLFGNTKHRSTAMDVLSVKSIVEGPGIYSTAARLKQTCFICNKNSLKKLKAICGGQDDSIKPNYRINDRVFADLAGPFRVGSLTIHILIWVCTVTGYVSAWTMGDRSRRSFTKAFKALADMHNGYPREIYTDNESGMISALDGSLYEEHDASSFQIIRVAVRVFLCAAYNHQAHGSVERRVRSLKDHLGSLDWTTSSLQELNEAIISIVRLINCTPIAAKVQGEINPVIELICPQNLMTPGRTNGICTPIVYHRDYDQMREELNCHYDSFVKIWQQVTIDTRLPSQVFHEQSAEPAVGDVVVMRDPHSIKPKTQTGIIINLLPGDDGIVRKVGVKILTRSKRVGNFVNETVSIRSIRDLCVIPRSDSEFGKLTLDLQEKHQLVEHTLPSVPEEFDNNAEVETQPIVMEDDQSISEEQQYKTKRCDVRIKRLPLPILRDSGNSSTLSDSMFSNKPPTIKRARQAQEKSTRVLRSSQSQNTLTLSLLSSLITLSHGQLNMTASNATVTTLPEVIAAVGFDIEPAYSNRTPVTKHLSLLNTHTCETDETKYDQASATPLQVVFTQKLVDVEFYQCKVKAGLKAAWCGSNFGTTGDSRMHAAITIISPSVLKLTSNQCRRLMENGTLRADLYEYEGPREFAKPIKEFDVPYGYSTREQAIRGKVLGNQACDPKTMTLGPVFIKGIEFKQNVIFQPIEFTIKKHNGLFDSETNMFSIPGLVEFDSAKEEFFENEHGTFVTAKHFVKPDICARTITLFSGIANYYRRRLVGHEPEENQKGDIVIMNNKDNHSVAFVTAGSTEFCDVGASYRTNLKSIHLVPYQTVPQFQGAEPSSFGVDPYLSLKSRILSSSIVDELSIESVAFSLHERACQLNTISNLIKLGLLASMPEQKLLDTYHGVVVRRVGGVATVTYGVPLRVQLSHRVAGHGVCCSELSVMVNGTDNLPEPAFLLSISRVFSHHCTPVICSKNSPIYHAIPGPPVQDLLIKGQKLSWEDIHELQDDYRMDFKTFWICDDSTRYYMCEKPPSMLTTSPVIDRSTTGQIWTPINSDQEVGGLWSDEEENNFQTHHWITTALAATTQVLGIAMSGRQLRVQDMHQQIIELETEAKTAIINGFFPSFWNIAEYIPQFMISGLAFVTTVLLLMLFCCCYNALQNVRTCTANFVNSAGLIACNRQLIDEENAKLTILDVKTKLREQAELTTDLTYRVNQQSRKIQFLYEKELTDIDPPPYPSK